MFYSFSVFVGSQELADCVPSLINPAQSHMRGESCHSALYIAVSVTCHNQGQRVFN